MYIGWTKHLQTVKEKEEFEKDVYGSKRILNHLMLLLNEEENTLDRTEMDVKAFDNPNWAYKQAYKNGYRKAISILKTMIDLDHQDRSAKAEHQKEKK